MANVLAVKLIFIISLLAFLMVYWVHSAQEDKNKLNLDSCLKNEECASRNCKKSKCQPVECRNDKTCIEKGLRDFYCHKRSGIIPSIFPSECTPKRGHHQKCKHDRQCVSNKCHRIIRRCS